MGFSWFIEVCFTWLNNFMIWCINFLWRSHEWSAIVVNVTWFWLPYFEMVNYYSCFLFLKKNVYVIYCIYVYIKDYMPFQTETVTCHNAQQGMVGLSVSKYDDTVHVSSYCKWCSWQWHVIISGSSTWLHFLTSRCMYCRMSRNPDIPTAPWEACLLIRLYRLFD